MRTFPYLSNAELKVLGGKEIVIKRLAAVRDIFLFSCYTGFAYIDATNLTVEHIKRLFALFLCNTLNISSWLF